ncbi:MAG: ABC transporter permease [Spirochaetia bacterium]
MIIENIRLSLKTFVSNKMRTSLSMLGIIIGIASVILITTLGNSATNSITGQIMEAGADMISVMLREENAVTSQVFDEDLPSELETVFPEIAYALPYHSSSFTLQNSRNIEEGVQVIGVPSQFFQAMHYQSNGGTVFSSTDDAQRRSVVVLGAEIAENLFPNSEAVGSYIRITRNQARTFKVIAVMQEKSDTMGMSYNTSVYIPYQTYVTRLRNTNLISRLIITIAEGRDVLEASDAIEAYLTRRTGNSDTFRVISPSTIAEMAEGILNTLNLLLVGVAAISLLVGGIGIMNIMLVSVSERTKEIGIRKALGASPTVIRGQFLIESICLTMIGGVFGIIIGLGTSYAASSLLNWVFLPNYLAVLLAMGFSSLVGIFFGLYPAVKASKLDPIKALSFE